MAPRAVIILVNYQCDSEVENGDDPLKSALFQAAKKPENIQALKVMIKMHIHSNSYFPFAQLSFTTFIPQTPQT